MKYLPNNKPAKPTASDYLSFFLDLYPFPIDKKRYYFFKRIGQSKFYGIPFPSGQKLMTMKELNYGCPLVAIIRKP